MDKARGVFGGKENAKNDNGQADGDKPKAGSVWEWLKGLFGGENTDAGEPDTAPTKDQDLDVPQAPILPTFEKDSTAPDQGKQPQGTTRGDTTMGVIADSADELMAAITKTPLESARQLEAIFDDLREYEEKVSKAKQLLASRITEEFPADPSIPEMVHRQAMQTARFAASNTEVQNALRRAHHNDWERIDNPRNQEGKWDHQTNNQD